MPITFFFVDQVFLFSARRIVVDNAIFYLSISQWIPEIFAVKFEHCLKLHQLLYILPSQILRGNAPWLVCLLARSPPGWFAPATFAPWLVRPLCLADLPFGLFSPWLVRPWLVFPLVLSPSHYHLYLGVCQVAKFRGAIHSTLEVIGMHSVNLKLIFDPFFEKELWGWPHPRWGCTSKTLSFSSRCENLGHSTL